MKLTKYERVMLTKGEFFSWMLSTLEANGWESVGSNPAQENYVYRSKGLDGKSDIIVNLRDGYNSPTGYNFSTGTWRHFEMGMLISYTPSDNVATRGVAVPNISDSNLMRTFIGFTNDALHPDAEMMVHYTCNANRLIVVLTVLVGDPSTTYFMFGRADDTISKEYKDTGNIMIATHAYRYTTGTWGVADRPTTTRVNLDIVTIPTHRGFVGNKVWLNEIAYGTKDEGIKGTIEGLYTVSTALGKSDNATDNGDMIVDKDGNEFTILFNRTTTSSNYANLLNERYIAVCTKLGSEIV